jgi:hypothetical protein
MRNARGQVTGVSVTRRSTPMGPVDYNPDSTPSLLPTQTQVAALPSATAPTGVAADVPMPRPVPGRARNRSTATAYAPSSNGGSSNPTGEFFSGLYTSSVSTIDRTANSVRQVFGFGQSEPQTAQPSNPPRQRAARPNPQRSTAPPTPPVRAAAEPAPARTPAKPAQGETRPAAAASLVTGAQPVLPSGTFENRWGAVGR